MNREDRLALAVDIGGSKMDVGLLNTAGELLGERKKYRVPFREDGSADPEGLIDLIAPHVEQARQTPGELLGIGLSVCGNIDEATGEAILVPNLHWRYLPFGEMTQRRFGLPVYSATDVRMAALAEALWGAARGVNYFAWATIGTGYGGFLFLRGELYGGYHGFAGNFGHIAVDEIHGYPCGCGQIGCLETFVSGPAIARAGQAARISRRSPLLAELAQSGEVTTRMVFQAEAQGDPAAQEIIQDVVRRIAISFGGLVNILDLEMIVVGGGVAHATPDFVERISRRMRNYLMTQEARRDLRVVKESFLNSALYGAAADVFLRLDVLSL